MRPCRPSPAASAPPRTCRTPPHSADERPDEPSQPTKSCAMRKPLLALTLVLAASTAGAAQSCDSVTPETCTIAKSLKRGINMGNMLDAPREGDWGVKFDPSYVGLVAGPFQTVRVPVRWSNHAAKTADATIDE